MTHQARDRRDRPKLSEYLKTKREAAGLSIRELARLTGAHHAYLARLETGERTEPSAELLQRIAGVLETDAAELLAYIGMEPVYPEPRTYFRQQYGVTKAQAEEIARMVERFTKEKGKSQGGKEGETR